MLGHWFGNATDDDGKLTAKAAQEFEDKLEYSMCLNSDSNAPRPKLTLTQARKANMEAASALDTTIRMGTRLGGLIDFVEPHAVLLLAQDEQRYTTNICDMDPDAIPHLHNRRFVSCILNTKTGDHRVEVAWDTSRRKVICGTDQGGKG